jgi:hypothetical protein
MAIEFGLGQFGDRRLKKGVSISTVLWLSGRAPVFDGLRDAGRKRCGFGAFCAIPP